MTIHIPRAQSLQDFERHLDTFEDVPDGGLADTDAYRAAMHIEQALHPDGLLVRGGCSSCSKAFAFVITWPELTALAYGVSPSDPRIQADPHWRISPVGRGRQAPVLRICNCTHPGEILVERSEATNALEQGREYAASSGEARAVYARIKQAGLG